MCTLTHTHSSHSHTSLTPLLRGRRGTMCTAKGSDVRPGVPLAFLGLRLFCVAGVGQWALPRGRMCAPVSLWRPLVSASFAWQAWDLVHYQGVGCTPGVPLASLGLRLFCVAGVGQWCALPRGRMYAPVSLWRPWVSASFALRLYHAAIRLDRLLQYFGGTY